jgi:hypothetical protein
LRRPAFLGLRSGIQCGFITLPRESLPPHPFTRRQTDAGLQRTANTPVRAECRPSKSNLNRFPSSNFTYCFILFPKCFSSFPHGTCSLSVSRQYLALDGIYHPIGAAFPNNSTLGKHTTMHTGVLGTNGIVTLIDAVFQPTYPRSGADVASRDYNSDPERARFQS